MNLREIRILYGRELRSALRERTIVFNTILLPVFLYPVILWAMFTALTFIQGRNEGFTSRVALVAALPSPHPVLAESLRADANLSFWNGETTSAGGFVGISGDRAAIPVVDSAAAHALLRNRELDAVLLFTEPDGEAAALAGNFEARILFDRAIDRSRRARDRVSGRIDDYRAGWLAREAERMGLSEAEQVRFAVRQDDVSTGEDLGAFLLGQMISLFLVIMVALGCFVPSVDTTAGERERSTWETLMTVGAARRSVVVAKYLHVATLGILAGSLNVIALFISIGAVLRPLLSGVGAAADTISFQIPLAAWPMMIVGAVALALFFSAAMMILAAFARSFKDGQAMVQPVYWMVFLPLLLGSQTDATLTPALASIPVANVSMMIRDAVNGVFLWPLIAQTLAVTLGTIVLCLVSARAILGFEELMTGAYDGSFWRFLKDRAWRGRRAKA